MPSRKEEKVFYMAYGHVLREFLPIFYGIKLGDQWATATTRAYPFLILFGSDERHAIEVLYCAYPHMVADH
ncbi:hypothetical protein RIF29_30795 [Crotalaria pallida]|uniref:Uncharacterized protein n=1 Tax=Crotalaria pallida TaxID=3830 RepID=A0AAN9HYF9_CROPI